MHSSTYCEYGWRHSTCRCPAPDKAIKMLAVPCTINTHIESPRPLPERAPKPYVPKHRLDVPHDS